MTKKDMADVIAKLEGQQSTLKDKQLRLKQRGEELERLAGSTSGSLGYRTYIDVIIHR